MHSPIFVPKIASRSWVIGALLLAAAGASGQGLDPVVKEFYVGRYNPANPCTSYIDNTILRPFYDIDAAVEQVRAWLATAPNHGAVIVHVAGGEYPIREPLEFTAADSGTATYPILWQAWSGAGYQPSDADVLISGGYRLSREWSTDGSVSVPDANVWKLHIDDLGLDPADVPPPSRDLWYNGRRLIRARFPNPPASQGQGDWPDEWPDDVLEADNGVLPPFANEGFLVVKEVVRDLVGVTQAVVVHNGLDPADPMHNTRRTYQLPEIGSWVGVELVGFNGYVAPRQVIDLADDAAQGDPQPGTPTYYREATFTFDIHKVRVGNSPTPHFDLDYQDLGGFGVFDLEDGSGNPPKEYPQRFLEVNGEVNRLGPLPPAQVYFENHFKFLDRIGEWYRGEENIWVVLPLCNDPNNPGAAQGVVTPMVDKVLVLTGTEHVYFQGIDWAYANMPFPHQGHPDQTEPGYASIQSGWQWMEQSAAFNITSALPGAVELRGANFITFDACRFGHFGGSGITIGQRYDKPIGSQYYESSDNTILQCEVFDVGGHGVYLGDQRTQQQNGWAATHLPNVAEPHERNTITQSYIHHYSVAYRDGAGLFVAHTRDTTITDNAIELGNWSGMAIGGLLRHQFDEEPPVCAALPDNPEWPQTNDHILIERNFVHKACLRLNDGAGIYVMGSQKASTGSASTLDGNFVLRIDHDPFKNFVHRVVGLYFDGGSDGWVVKNNYVALAQYPFHFGAGQDDGVDTAPSEDTKWGGAAWPIPWIPTTCNTASPTTWPGLTWSTSEPNWWWIPADEGDGYAGVTRCPGYYPMSTDVTVGGILHTMRFPAYGGAGSHENWTITNLGDGGSQAIGDSAGPDSFGTWFPGTGERIFRLNYLACQDAQPYQEVEWPW